MLILSRYTDEKILVGNDVEIMVTEIRWGRHPKVKLGIQAPPGIVVVREELAGGDGGISEEFRKGKQLAEAAKEQRIAEMLVQIINPLLKRGLVKGTRVSEVREIIERVIRDTVADPCQESA